MLITNVVCAVQFVAEGGYQFFILVCAFSWIFPFLHDMATHGKTRDEAAMTAIATTSFDRIISSFLNQSSLLVPKTRFRHFYWAAFAWLVIVLSVAPSLGGSNQWFKMSTFLLFCHILRRSYECMCIHRWRKDSRMHIAGYLLGLQHYLLLPFTFVHLPGCRDVVLQGRTTLPELSYSYGGVSYVRSLYITLPIAVFSFWAQYQQYRHHVMLANLRRPRRGKHEVSGATSTAYTLPVSGWFRSLVCPHYLAEILIYLSFDLLISSEMQKTQSNGFWMGQQHWLLLWVTFNLVTSALMNLRWYQANITPAELMTGKKAIFPGLL